MEIDTGHSFAKSDNYYNNARSPMLRFVPATAKKTLEFGCASGNFSEQVKVKFGAECWGVEIDAGAALIASQKLYRVVNADAVKSLAELPDRYFDCIIFNDVLEHLVDPYFLLGAVRAKLNAGGVVVASIPNVRFWNNLRNLVWRGDWDYTEAGILDNSHLRFFTYNSITKMFGQLGYQLITIHGLRPTHSAKFKILNFILLGRLRDARFHQFACVAKPLMKKEDQANKGY